MQIKLVSVPVDDQDKALRFYTEVLGFEPCADVPMGAFRWLTVTSPDGMDGVELVLEPMRFPPAQVYQAALFNAGIPVTSFISDNIHLDYARMRSLGVVFRSAPKDLGPVTTAIFEDTCGNLITLAQPADTD
jgi:catechol 2,3-dioxygenase-like lactoylglutathione lyase family enzyme